MLRINAIPNSEAAKAYYGLADYLIEGQEQEAHWHGKGAELLGLRGKIDQNVFEVLCDNINPNNGKQLTAKHIENRRVGYDFTFSVPKSVSLAYSLGLDNRIPDDFRGAVADTMAEMEREMSTRVRQKGKDEDRTTGNMIWTDFTHHTSRPINGTPDPQLHIHAVVFNATFDREENQWKAGQFGELKANAPYFQAVFRARLANRLKALGYEIKVKKDDFEIVGVPERTLKEFSRRTSLIEKTADLLSVKKPETKAKLGATTREAKKEGQTWGSLVSGWEKRLQPGELQAIHATVLNSHREPVKLSFDNREALDWSLRHLLERKSVVGQRELLTTALKHGIGRVTLEGLHDELGKRKDLIRRDLAGQTMVSTQGVLGEEKRIVAFAVRGRGKFRPLGQPVAHDRGPDATLAGTVSPVNAGGRSASPHAVLSNRAGLLSPPPRSQPDHATLSPSQSSAVKHAWYSRDRLILIRGAAGTGKTTMTKALLEGVDVPWVVLAPSAEASRGVLRREGFEGAETLAKFLFDKDTQEKARSGLIVLDEASLAGAHDMARLIQVADSLNARILLLGDRRQHKSVARGDVLTLLEDRAGLPVAEVSEIRRQGGEYREAVKLASQGRVSDAFSKLDKLGWVKQGGHEQIAEDYAAALRDGKSVLVVSPTHAEGEAVTAAIREKLKQQGSLKGEERTFESLVPLHLTEAERGNRASYDGDEVLVFQRAGGGHRAGDRVVLASSPEHPAALASRFTVFRPSAIKLQSGDHLRITANGKDLTGKHRLNNGATYSVDGFTDAGNIRLSNGWVISKDFGHFSHGYAVTSHAAQGKTVDRVLIAQSAQSFPASGKEQFYVSVSRGRERATIYTSDKDELRDAIQREDRRMLASDLVRTPRKGVRERLKRRVSFLRELGSRLMDHAQGRGMHRDRVIERD